MAGNTRYTKIDDGLDGVDDFLDEPNPFEEVDVQGPDANKTVPDFVPTDHVDMLPPAYDATIQLESDTHANDTNNARDLPAGFLNYYSRYFQMSAETLRRRVLSTLKFNGSIFANEDNADISEREELYGAVWITTSVILIKFLFPSLIDMFFRQLILGENVGKEDSGSTLYGKLITSVWLFAIYTFCFPLVVGQAIKNRPAEAINQKMNNWVNLISCYGYNNLIWLVVFPVCDVLTQFKNLKLISLVQWAIVALGWVKSALFFSAHLKVGETTQALTSTGPLLVLVGGHAIFCILVLVLLK
ncbi:Yip5p KNAG_0E03430 [Huiozyma naganishii CBS 8797]|uniref:Protein YIP n=1 Tax=Huiozyma naganishii (strain ATCC MYA-139 / BCRC 22969 / CBS 8797 / KCTC 17520 / NBRC 10181 / NCYC 3082 / Yp74L-3) TaxID=1071383 RepID=J7R6W9_HUIN7|nr:hypothetical protein KNAG_0E03430 [Kazachstania naganishii CBS 8797]CCK70600.1 hypothetical protein KNAG_0E03430 [Kazachstania naganishii CBS 8797]